MHKVHQTYDSLLIYRKSINSTKPGKQSLTSNNLITNMQKKIARLRHSTIVHVYSSRTMVLLIFDSPLEARLVRNSSLVKGTLFSCKIKKISIN